MKRKETGVRSQEKRAWSPAAPSRTRKNWIEQTNPLRTFTPAKVVGWMEELMRGQMANIQWAFHTIEAHDPDLLALVERCLAPLAAMDWDIREEKKTGDRKPESGGAAANRLRAAYDKIENLSEAISWLALARFRGFSILQCQDKDGNPAAPGECVILKPIPHWCFARDGLRGAWKWNPDAEPKTFDMLPEDALLDPGRDRLIIRERARPIDRVAIVKFLRSNYTQKAWADFIETAARQGVALIEPPNVEESARGTYKEAAQAFSEGNNSSLPNGSSVVFANAQRGAAPFEAHMRFLREQLILAGTGGLLTMLSMPQGIGAGASGEHGDAFDLIVASEAAEISEALQTHFDRRVLAAPERAWFQLAARESIAPKEILVDAELASRAGLELDPAELSEKTGYKLTKKAMGVGSPEAGGGFPRAAFAAGAPRGAAVFNAGALGALTKSAERRLAEAQLESWRPIAEKLQRLYDLAEDGTEPDTLAREARAFADRDLPGLFQLLAANPLEQEAWLELLAGAFAEGVAANDSRKLQDGPSEEAP